jgi:hypothetical protein
MPRHTYLRAYMAGIALPSAFMVVVLTAFCVVRLALEFPVPIERAIVFPMALVPNLWGLWNMLYQLVRQRARIPIGIFGAVVPLLIGPLALVTARGFGLEIPHVVLEVFPVGLAVAVAGYYLIWKYLVGFLNGVLEIA